MPPVGLQNMNRRSGVAPGLLSRGHRLRAPTSHTLDLTEVNAEHTVYLVEVEDEDELVTWLAQHHQELFERELWSWYTDPALWPKDRSLTILQA